MDSEAAGKELIAAQEPELWFLRASIASIMVAAAGIAAVYLHSSN